VTGSVRGRTQRARARRARVIERLPYGADARSERPQDCDGEHRYPGSGQHRKDLNETGRGRESQRAQQLARIDLRLGRGQQARADFEHDKRPRGPRQERQGAGAGKVGERGGGPNPALYLRRARELVGHNECIIGSLDSYPADVDGIAADQLEAIEHACIRWRWQLKKHTSRLRQIHGDFHPWNLLFQDGVNFVVLDRSRGEWGDPADDVACLTLNYVFFSLQNSERLEGGFERLFSRFWRRYLDATNDDELRVVVAPFFAFRALVMANPVWYPRLPARVRSKLIAFVKAVLDAPALDPTCVNEYCG
jgi:hypothetical protein